MDVINSFIRAQGSKFWGKWGSGIKITARKRDQWVPDIPCYDPDRSFSLSRNKKINWKPSSGRSKENEML